MGGPSLRFPLLVAGLSSFFLPIGVPARASVTHELVSHAKRPRYEVPYRLVIFMLIPPMALFQAALYDTTSYDAAIFAHHFTSQPSFSLLPGALIAVAIALPIVLHSHMWMRNGDLDDAIGRLAGSVPAWLYRLTVAFYPVILWALTSCATLLNLAALDTFLEVGNGELRYSRFLDATTRRHSLADVERLVVHARRRTTSTTWDVREWLSIELKDGTVVDTIALIGAGQASEVVAAFESIPAFAGSVIRDDEPRPDEVRWCRDEGEDEAPCAG